MDEAAAERINAFADEALITVDALIGCCAVGISCSPAVAAAIMRGKGLDGGSIWDDTH